MANVLRREKQEQVCALGRLGWSLRRIEEETGVRRETASSYLKRKRRVTPTISVRQQPSVEAVYGATIRRRISSRLALT